MRPARRLAIGLLLAVWLAAPPKAAAEDSVWARAQEPKRHERALLLTQVDTILHEHLRASTRPSAFRRSIALHQARRLLEARGAATSRDVALRLRLARVMSELYDAEGEVGQLENAVLHLTFVAEHARPTTLQAWALGALGVALARLGHHEQEIAAYDRGIAAEPDPLARTTLLANQAEGYMAQGHLAKAIRGYRRALAATPGGVMTRGGVTTLWGLAVALDRAGDLDGALESIRAARAFDPHDTLIHGPGWFYVPAYDEDWYMALGHWQSARDEAFALEGRIASYDLAIAALQSYVNRAPADDRWLPLASMRLTLCERERTRLRGRRPAAAEQARPALPSPSP
ncbi:MAG: tetratricopeptide repeat protein [Polyangiaceae bacterium]